MTSALLATRTRVPPQTRHVLARATLVDTIERHLPGCRLVLLSAPAGYGKTTLLAEWARSTSHRVVWLALDERDDDLVSFLRSLLTAWDAVRPGMRESTLGLLLSGAAPDHDALLTALAGATETSPDPTAIVLDDCHLLAHPAVLAALRFLVDHLPETVTLVMAGRASPSLPLARLRARHQLLELRAEDLSLPLEESAHFLTQVMGLDLSDHEIADLHAQTEGWIAGLQLAALTIERGLTPSDRPAISGRHRFIADFLGEEVLALVPDDLRRFLLQVCILDRLCGPLCDAVTGRHDTQDRLERLERNNLFIVPLDDRREWFRFHRLFADHLRTELARGSPDQIEDLHRRAAIWYLANDLPEQAFDHAVAANDPGLVMQLGEHHFEVKLLGREFTLLGRWLDSLPIQWQADYPLVGLYQAGLALFTGEIDAGARRVDGIERRLAEADEPVRQLYQARVTAVRCAIACFQNDLVRAEAYAAGALQELPADDHAFRTAIHHALGDTYRRNGRWSEARTNYLKTLELVDEPAYRIRSAHVYAALADLDGWRGHLRSAATYWRRALASIEDRSLWGSLPLPLIGWVFIRLGELLYEWNDLAAARLHVARGLERAELGGDVRAIVAGRLLAARLDLAEGEREAAAAPLATLPPVEELTAFPDLAGRYNRLRVEVWLAQRRLDEIAAWSAGARRHHPLQTPVEGEATWLAHARALIAQDDPSKAEDAQQLLTRLLEAAGADDLMGVQVEAMALMALAQDLRGDRTSALISLERTLRLAEPEGYVRIFVDLGRPMARLLHEAGSRGVMPGYVARLLAAFGAGAHPPGAAGNVLIEPLSPRELDVLRLIAAGLTNREIGSRLAISPETVKKHAASLYSKLGVGRRTEAAARARALDLLD